MPRTRRIKRHQAIKAEAEQFGEKPSKGIDATAERITRKAKSQDTETLDQVATRFGAELDEAAVALHGADGLEPVENLAGEYLSMLSAGLLPQLLDDAEIQKVVARFTDYGRLG